MSVSVRGHVIDERFLSHRLGSTSLAGIIGGLLSIFLFSYRFFVNGVWSWDLFTIAITIVLVKLSAMAWYRFTD
jgi:hypothetical protein